MPDHRGRWLVGAVLMAGFGLTGCVERRYTIRTEPPGALVIANGEPIGVTPVSKSFTFYGNRTFRIIKEGYETKDIVQPMKAPWFDNLATEFFTESTARRRPSRSGPDFWGFSDFDVIRVGDFDRCRWQDCELQIIWYFDLQSANQSSAVRKRMELRRSDYRKPETRGKVRRLTAHHRQTNPVMADHAEGRSPRPAGDWKGPTF